MPIDAEEFLGPGGWPDYVAWVTACRRVAAGVAPGRLPLKADPASSAVLDRWLAGTTEDRAWAVVYATAEFCTELAWARTFDKARVDAARRHLDRIVTDRTARPHKLAAHAVEVIARLGRLGALPN